MASSWSDYPEFFSPPSFVPVRSGANLTGGANATPTIYDSGSLWVTVNGTQKSVGYGQGSTNTSVATALRDAINADGGYPVSAALSGSTLTLTARTTGAATNYSLTSGSSTAQPGSFSQPSFNVAVSGAALTGGSDGTGVVYDTGSVWVTVNGVQKSVSYGQGSTVTTVAIALRDAINADGGPVTASLSGSTLTLTARTTGAATNYSLAKGSSTSQPGTFPGPSFTVAVSGAALTGGSDGQQSVVKFHHHDHLSMRVSTDSGGNIVASSGHYPYGESWYETGGANKLKFTSYERDSETGNDYAMFRSHIPRLGRFNRPDPIAGSIANPQSLNRYTYVQNNPINATDPLGLFCPGLWVDSSCVPGNGDPTKSNNAGSSSVVAALGSGASVTATLTVTSTWTPTGMYLPGSDIGISSVSFTFSWSFSWTSDAAQGGGIEGFDPNLRRPNVPLPIELVLKQTILSNSDCAALLGGPEKASSILNRLNSLVDVSNRSYVPDALEAGPVSRIRNGTSLAAVRTGYNQNPSSLYYGDWLGGPIKFLYGQAFKNSSADAKITILIHELMHVALGQSLGNFVLHGPNNVNLAIGTQLITSKCGTTSPI